MPRPLALLSLAAVLGACADAPPPPAAAPAPAGPPKDADALVLSLVVDGPEAEAARASFEAVVARSPAVELGPGASEGRRSLELRLVTGEAAEAGGALARTVTLTGKLPGGCQVLTFAPTLTQPGAKAAHAPDREELARLGAENVARKLADLAPKIGPNATCIATGK